MAVSVGPARFYGSSLPRPRFYSAVKFNDERVDPPATVMGALLSWSADAHWSMGGVSFQRHRLQGRIEGSINKLRLQQEGGDSTARSPNIPKASGADKILSPPKSVNASSEDEDGAGLDFTLAELAHRRKRGRAAADSPRQKKRVRKLGDVFDDIAADQKTGLIANTVSAIASRTRSKKSNAD